MTGRVYKEDLRALGYCFRAARPWFADRGLDWSDFIENGIDIRTLRERGDALSDRLIEYVEEREQSGT